MALPPPRKHPTSLVKAKLDEGLACHQAGRFKEAHAAYAEVLAIQADNPEALRLNGVALAAIGRLDESLAAFAEALRVHRPFPEAHYNLGNVLQTANRLPEAIASYEQAIKLRPQFVEALCNLGNALMATERFEEARVVYEKAIKQRPGFATVLNNLSVVYRKLDRIDDAVDAAARAVASSPRHVDSLNSLGIASKLAGRPDDAMAAYRRAIAVQPRLALLHYNLGITLDDLGRHEEAVASFHEAIALNAFYPEALLSLGVALQNLERWAEAREAYEKCLRLSPKEVKARINLGTTFQKELRFDDAIAQYRLALTADEHSREARNNLGTALQSARRWPEAVTVLRELVEVEPRYADAWNNLGLVLGLTNSLPEAEVAIRRALDLEAGHAEAHNNLGNVLLSSGRPFEAIDAYRSASLIDPKMDVARFNEGVGRLLTSDLVRGWPLYEHRYAMRPAAERDRFLGRARWKGEALAGRAILVHAEQGLGDTLQFVRYVPLLAARGAIVHVEVQAALTGLLQGLAGAATVFAAGEPLPAFDLHCPMLSLPLGFQTTLETIPGETPYLKAALPNQDAWTSRVRAVSGRRIGFVWSGNPKHGNDHNRSIPLETFERLFTSAPGDHFFSLQKEASLDDSLRLAAHPNVTDLAPFLSTFADTAAAIRALDLVISVDTSVAHLAGALGAALWVLVPHSPDWRWLLNRRDNPWYPSARVFRQPATARWPEALAEVAGTLAETRAAAAPPPILAAY
jgi:tetratricopeptide (TPR) repeat protein